MEPAGREARGGVEGCGTAQLVRGRDTVLAAFAALFLARDGDVPFSAEVSRAAAWIEAVRLATLSYSLFCIVAVTLADGPAWHLMLWYLTLITINLGHAAYLLYERTLVPLLRQIGSAHD